MKDTQGDLVEARNVPARGRVDIMASILEEVRLSAQGLRKTRLMYRCNLSFRQLKVYLGLLVDKRFLKPVDADINSQKVLIYRITDEGRSFLRSYSDMKKSLNEEVLPR
jgi:predicted transcriptional regulator